MSKNVQDQSHSTKKDSSQDENIFISVSFFTCAVLIFFCFSIVLSGAQDILAATEIQTSIVLLAGIGPYVLVVCVLPYFAKRIPYIARFVFGFLSSTTAFIIIGVTHDVNWKLFGVTLVSFAEGVLDMSVTSLTSYFDKSVLSAYSSGSGAGFLIGPLYYTAMTTWFCVSPNITLLIVSPAFLLFLLCYYLIQKEITKDIKKGPATKEEISYSKLHSSDDEDNKNVTEEKQAQNSNQRFSSRETLTWKKKLMAVKKLLVLVGAPIFIAFVAEYLLLQSVVTTLAYTNAPFPPRDHYQYYVFTLMVGEVLGRSHRSLIGVINPKWLYTPTLKGLWALSIIEVLHLLFFLFESWCRFLPGVGIVILLCLTAGLTIGLLFCYYLAFIQVTFKEEEQEFIFGLSLFLCNFGILSASMLGLYVEPRLKEHCIATVKDSSYCFTRTIKSKDVITSCQTGMKP